MLFSVIQYRVELTAKIWYLEEVVIQLLKKSKLVYVYKIKYSYLGFLELVFLSEFIYFLETMYNILLRVSKFMYWTSHKMDRVCVSKM